MIKLNDALFVMELGGTGDQGCHAVLSLRQNCTALFDVGFPFTHDELVAQLAEAGVATTDLTALLITHHDGDHMGGGRALLAVSPQLKVFALAEEAPYIDGTLPPLKGGPERAAQAADTRFPVDVTLADGQVLSCGITVIHTLGHTKGHAAYYLPESKTLIAGDQLVAFSGVLQGPRPEYCYDIELAHQQLQRFLDFDIDTIICYHGGVVSGDIRAELERVIAMGPGAVPSPPRD